MLPPVPPGFPDLEYLVRPRSIAIVGASDDGKSAGYRGTLNLLEHSTFGGDLYFVNPELESVFGRPCWPSLDAVPADEIDVACLLVGPEDTISALEAATSKTIGYVVIWSPGFAEMDDGNSELQTRLMDIARRGGMRIYGPNSPGTSNFLQQITLTPSGVHRLTTRPGPVGAATQGGGLGRNILQNLHARTGVGMWLSAGNEADLEISDFIVHLVREPSIRAIAAVVEGLVDGQRFVKALEYAAEKDKPVVVLKIGKSADGTRAVRSHTASLAGSAEVTSTVLAQFGAIEVDDTDELSDTAALITRVGQWRGNRVCVLSYSGGSNGLCSDHVAKAGLAMSELAEATVKGLCEASSRFATHRNPLDIGAEVLSNPQSAKTILDLVLADDNVDIILSAIPMEHEDVTAVLAGILADAQARTEKLIVPVWNTGLLGDGYKVLCERGMTPFLTIAGATKALARIDRYYRWAREPHQRQQQSGKCRPSVRTMSEGAAKSLLREFGINAPEGALARDTEDAVRIAQQVGYPVAVKASGPQILHKSENGLLVLDVDDAQALRSACRLVTTRATRLGLPLDGILVEKMSGARGLEMLVGAHFDSVFGPILTIGMGGVNVEIDPDVSRRKLPVSEAEIDAMVGELRHAPLLKGYRSFAPRDITALTNIARKVAELALTGTYVEINPVVVGGIGEPTVALDATILF